MSGRVFRIGRYVNGLKGVNQACVGWRNSKYSIGMNRKSFGLFTFTIFCSINVIDYICYRSIAQQIDSVAYERVAMVLKNLRKGQALTVGDIEK